MKAQLHKMTLYICDLEDSLSQYEIENLIEDRALNGVAVNCICHFADQQIGKQVEWDDDIDINRCDCPASAWDKYFTPPTAPKTNADRIRAMTDEELAEFLDDVQYREWEYRQENSREKGYFQSCVEGWLNWLQQPAEGE